jgi:hypothetical protein
MRQIHQALRLFHEGEWESVITLALAAEDSCRRQSSLTFGR